MSDTYGITTSDPGGPPINLPALQGSQPQSKPKIIITPGKKTVPTPEQLGLTPYKEPPELSQTPEDIGLTPYKEAEPPKPQPQLGMGEAVTDHLLNSFAINLLPAVAGLSAAAGPEWQQKETYGEGDNPLAPIAGAVKMLHNYFSDHPDQNIQEAYRNERDAARERLKAGSEQYPYSTLGATLGGTLLTPGLGAMARMGQGLGIVGRTAAGIGTGMVGGAGFGAGEAISEGQSPSDILKSTGKGAGAGAIFGTAGTLGAEALGGLGRRVAQIARGRMNPEDEAARRILEVQAADFERAGPPMTQEELNAARAAGAPTAIGDFGPGTRSMGRMAANVSSGAQDTLDEFLSQRLAGQKTRIADTLRRMTGGGDSAGDTEALRQAARTANRPAYARAYAAGDRPIWSPELERLSASPDLQAGFRSAEGDWKAWQVRDGYGAANPPVRVTPDGRFERTGGKGVPTYPNIQFWDYATRGLRGAADKAERSGDNALAGRLRDMDRAVKSELDRIVPQFGQARAGAATFFGAQDALDAGRNFVMRDFTRSDAARQLARMSDPERELFARGFATDIIEKVENTNDGVSVINSIFGSQAARDKIRMALGNDPARANEFEALLRAERVMDLFRKEVMGNSTTVRQLRQLAEHGAHTVAGGTAVAAFEGIREHDLNPAHIMTGAFLWAAARKGVQGIDARVARNIGEMLASDNPAIFHRGLQVVSRSPVLLNALRSVQQGGTRVLADRLGLPGAAAAASTALGASGQLIGGEGEHHQKDDPTYLQ